MSGRDRDLARFHERFATIYASVALAIRTGVLTWSARDAFEAILACAEAHLDLVAAAGRTAGAPVAPADPLAILRHYVQDHRSRFVDARVPISDGAHDHDACPGYIGEHKGRPEYLFSEERGREIFSRRAAEVKAALRRAGVLNATTARPSTRRTLQAGGEGRRVPVIAVQSAFLDGS